MSYGEVYLRYCWSSQKGYVGQTTVGERIRWRDGKYDECPALNNAIKKYGKDSFETFIIAEASSQEELNKLEAHYIQHLNTLVPNGYNLLSGGDGKGHHHPETRIKMSKASKGRRKSVEHCENIRKSKLGVPRPAFVCAAISAYRKAHVGWKHSEETRAKMRTSWLHRKEKGLDLGGRKKI